MISIFNRITGTRIFNRTSEIRKFSLATEKSGVTTPDFLRYTKKYEVTVSRSYFLAEAEGFEFELLRYEKQICVSLPLLLT